MSVDFLRVMGVLNSDKLEDVEKDTSKPMHKVEDSKYTTNANSDDANDEIEEDWYSLSKEELIERLIDICNDYAEVVDKRTELLDDYERLLDNYENLLNEHERLLDEHEELLASYNDTYQEYNELLEEYE